MRTIDKPDEQRDKIIIGLIRKTVLRIGDQNGPIYLIRYSIFSCPWFSIKLHRIMMSDDDCQHDHPWSFVSIILWGGYFEVTSNDQKSTPWIVGFTSKWFGPGSVLWRPAPSPHSLMLPNEKPATTLVITFKKQREWGFITPSGWVKWTEYIRGGRKCE